MDMEAEVRKTAIDVVGDVPWGTHFCQFYRTREELIDILVPYLRAGLEDNEFCMWITSEPVGADDAHQTLTEEVRNLEEYVRNGQIEIVDHDQWYTRDGRFDPEEVLRGWAEKEKLALERGFEGIRVCANASRLERGNWGKLTSYEEAAHQSIAKSRALAVCAYWLDKCSASEIIDVVSNHQFALIRQDGKWRIIESPAHKRTYEALKRSEQRYALAQRAANIGSWDWNIETGDLHWSDRIEPLFGFAPGQFRATYEAFLECVHPDDRRHVIDSVNASIERGDEYAIEHRIVWPDGTVRWVAETGDVIRDKLGKAIRMLGIVQDITRHKHMEANQKLAGQILACLNRESVGTDLIRDLLGLIKKATGLDAVAIRQREGNDFPYLEVDGFSDDFVKAENYLCCHDETGEPILDAAGHPVIRCMCGNVLSGRADAALPFFTEAGSFWTNSISELIENTPTEILHIPETNQCKEAGYESLALIPLRCGQEIVGLLQLNDTRRGCFTPDVIQLFEEIGASIGIGIARMRIERELRLRNRIAEVFLTAPDDRMYGEVLEVLLEALVSEYGFFGYIDEAGNLVCPSLTREIWECCEMADKTIVFARETWGDNIWARAIASGKSQISNTPLKPPEGHVEVNRVLSVPVNYDQDPIGVITLANKRLDYTSDDQKLLESMAGFVAPVLHARLQRKRDLAQIENLARFPSENPNPVLRIASDGTLLYANSAGSKLAVSWGCETGEQMPENWCQYIASILESGKNEALEVSCEDRVFSLIVATVKDGGYANVYGSDVTERKRAEESLKEYRHHLEELVQTRTAELTQANEKLMQEIEERKRLEKEILNISEQEQRRIGRELHDSIGQQFTGIAFMMKVLEQKLTDKLPGEATEAAEIKKLVNQAMDQTRGLAKGLHPVDLDAGSLAAALQELASTTERMFGVQCDLQCDESVPLDDAETATHLYRITQEAITNAIRHGQARNIHVDLTRKKDKTILSIENDGLDFPQKLDRRKAGMGLQIMDHRADIIGASLEIGKGPEGGTIVTCSFSANR